MQLLPAQRKCSLLPIASHAALNGRTNGAGDSFCICYIAEPAVNWSPLCRADRGKSCKERSIWTPAVKIESQNPYKTCIV